MSGGVRGVIPALPVPDVDAAGWHVGLDQETARRALARTWKLIYDLIVGGMCVVAGLVALTLVGACGKQLPTSLHHPTPRP